MNFILKRLLLVALNLFLIWPVFSQVPAGFEVQQIADMGDEAPMGFLFINDSMFYSWTCNGKLYLFIDDIKQEDAVIDLEEEVGCWGDNGMLGMALDPNFESNGRIYFLYQVDTYHLFNADSADYNPLNSIPYSASIGRVTRYTIDISTYASAIPDSRFVLIGRTPQTGLPVLTSSHSVGSLQFGTDGTLMLTVGDGNTWWGEHTGGPPYPNYCYDSLALATGILRPQEDIGAFRAQYVDSYNGKVLRFDPETGEGLPSNPFFDSAEPDSPRSKVWALGLRNPFRMIYKPQTGSANPSDGDPGTFYISDVGFSRWEEINICNGPALNFGWPLYEGLDPHVGYSSRLIAHPDYENPLYNESGCPYEHYLFQNLLVQENAQHDYHWGNPCDEVVQAPDSLNRFVHARPAIAYQNATVNDEPIITILPGFNAQGQAVALDMEAASGIEGEAFDGLAGLGGDFYFGTAFPNEYFGAFFQLDYAGWTRVMTFNNEDEFTGVQLFSEQLGLNAQAKFNPYDECMYFAGVSPTEVKRVCFTGNVAPICLAEADIIYGASPLTVDLDGTSSFDPDGDPITFLWDLDDGSFSDQSQLTHTFVAPDSSPEMKVVTLQVTDTAGNSNTSELIISLNNTPPDVDITGVTEGQLYSIYASNALALEANIYDAEHSAEQLDYKWKLYLHHNTHFHLIDSRDTASDLLNMEGIGCEETADYYYRITLDVSDPAGLSSSDQRFLFPDCDEDEPGQQGFESFTLYPNPSTGLFTIRGPFVQDESYLVDVFSLDGKLLYHDEVLVQSIPRIGLDLTVRDRTVVIIQLTSKDISWSERLLLYEE